MLLIPTIVIHDRCMELQQMRYAVAVAEERNFTRAATKCHVVQSALSHQIKALEHELGVMLFARTSRRVELTEAGAAFVAAARTALAAADHAVAAAAEASGEIRGTLSIGVIPTVTALDLSALLAELHARHPHVRITLRAGSSRDFLASIRAGDLDAAILGLPATVTPSGTDHLVLAEERHVAVLGPGHRLGGRKRLRLAELAGETFVDFPAGSPGREQSDLAFAAAGLSRTVAFEVMTAEVILDLVARDLAVALLPPAIVPAGRGLSAVAVTGGPTRTEYLAWAGFNPSPAVLAFVDVARSHSCPQEPSAV